MLSNHVSEIKPIFKSYNLIPSYTFIFFQTGILQYYLAMLQDFTQYAELKSEVFQGFKEVGNTMIVCLLIEQVLVGLKT